jgi:hypothetical protein
MTTDRPNTELASAVDQAVDLAAKRGVHVAAAFLAECGAGFALTCRVLADEPRRRRRSGLEPVLAQEGLAGAPGGQVGLDGLNQLLKIRVSSR